MTLEFTVDPELTEALREQIVACWIDVSNAGGAVGFVPPVTPDEVRPVAQKLFAAVAAGHDRLIVGRESAGRLAALAALSHGNFALAEHWRKVKRVMVHPHYQGRGYGARLMTEVERVARTMGLEMLSVDVRGGTGNDVFYEKCGYIEYGRLPGGLRLRPDDYRDQIHMMLSLRE